MRGIQSDEVERTMSYQDQDQAGLGEGPRDGRLETKNLWRMLEEDGRFTRFLEAARAAGLDNNLAGPEFISVFAPTDEAVGSTDLQPVVAQHIVRGVQTAADIRTTPVLKTIEGNEIPVRWEQGTVVIGDAKVVHADIACTNGMLQVVDGIVRR